MFRPLLTGHYQWIRVRVMRQTLNKHRLPAAASDMESQLFQACTDGDLSILKDLISKCGLNPIDDEVRDTSGLTPLHLASMHGHLDIIHYLVKEQNCNPEATSPNGHTSLHFACKSGHLHITKCLITDYKCNPHCTDNTGYTPLHAASESGYLDIVEYLITENSCDTEISDSAGKTPLHYASESGHLNIVQCLITAYKCDPQKPNSRGMIPLHCACQNGHLEVAKYLIIKHKCNPKHGNTNGCTPLHSAAARGHLAVVKYLTSELDCNPQICDNEGLTPLHYATFNGHHDIVKFLLSDCNCDPQSCTNRGFVPLHCACQNGHLEVVKHLIKEHKCNPEHGNINGYTPLHSAAAHGHLAVVKYLISELGCNPQIGDNGDYTLLHSACQNGHLEVAKYLVTEHKCNPECGSTGGSTPLHSAVRNGHLAIVKYLISELGCNPQIGDILGHIPLYYATSYGHYDIVKFLLSNCNCDPQSCTSIVKFLHKFSPQIRTLFAKCIGTEHKCNPDTDGYTFLYFAVRNGDLAVVKYLISELGCNPQIGDSNGLTPLHYACQNGHLEVAKYLVTEHKCNPEHGNTGGYTPLHSASAHGHLAVVKYLISELGCNPKIGNNEGVTLLHCACLNGHFEVAKYLVTDHKCNPEHGNTDGCTPLHVAALYGHLAVVKYLIGEHGCNPQIGDNEGLTPLYYACQNGHFEVAKYLVTEHKCNPEHGNTGGYTPLHAAALCGHLTVVKYLISELGWNPQIGNSEGVTPLHSACQNGHFEVAKYLVTEYKCNPEHGNSDGYTPLHLAALYGHLAIVKYFISELGCNPQIGDNEGVTPLHCACLNGHFKVAKYLVTEYKCNPEHGNTGGCTPLHSAAAHGHLAVVKYLISELGCNPQIGDSNGLTPLHYACKDGHFKVAKYLVTEYKCNPEHGNTGGYTPLHSAAAHGHLAVVKYLINELGCNPKIGDSNGLTPLHYACKDGHFKVAKYLVTEYKCNPEHGNTGGYTPLHSAAAHGHLAVVKYLISELGCNPQICDNEGVTPLYCACQNGHFEVAKYLVTEHKVNPEHGNTNGCTPLHSAALCGHLAVVKYLISELGCNPQIGDNEGLTPLRYACQNGHFEVAKYLVTEHKCNPEHGNTDGCTPLHSAALCGHLAVVKYLISELGCNPQIGNNKGVTPLHYACQNGHLEVAKYLVTEHKGNPEHGNSDGYTPLHAATLCGHLAVVKYLISELGCNPQIGDNEGLTPLHYACLNGHFEVAKYLVTEHKCNPEHGNTDGCTPLHSAALCGHLAVVKYLISELGCNPQIGDNEGVTPLHCACQNGHLEVAKYLVTEHKVNPEHGNSDGYTPLHAAALCGHLTVVKYLISELGCNPQIGDNNATDLISKNNCNPQQVAKYCPTPLHCACIGGHSDVVEYLTQQNCACDSECSLREEWFGNHPLFCALVGTEGFTPLHWACLIGNVDVAKYLINICNCNPFHQCNSGMTPLDFAWMAGHLEIVKLVPNAEASGISRKVNAIVQKVFRSMTPVSLENACTNINFNRTFTPLHFQCIDKNKLEGVKVCTNQLSSDPSPTWILDITPLHLACLFGNLEIAMHLVTECGCDPKCVDQCGATPLHYACTVGHLELVKYLVTQCKCDQSDVFWGLVTACASGEMGIIKYLIPQCPDNLFCFLFTSCVCGHLDVVKYLIDECGCDPHYTHEDDGLTPLHCTCTDAKCLLMKDYNQSLESNTSSNVTNIKMQEMLFCIWQAISHHAVILHLHSTLNKIFFSDDVDTLDYIGDLECNTGPSIKMQDRLFYFWQAIRHIITPILQFINRFKNAATVPEVSNHDINHTVSTEHDSTRQLQLKFNVFKYLVAEQKCNTQCEDKDGRTPLHYACASGQLDIVQYLYWEKISDLIHTAHSGDTPLHIACKSNQVEITEFLLSTGECDPLCKNEDGITPLEIATSVEIRELLDHFCKGNYPLESVVKVFVLGNPLAGKSSMVQALQTNPGIISSLIGRFQRIKGVTQQTAGIDSISFSSNDFGNVVIYDFAGQPEFLTSHAAFLQNSSSELAAIFIVVTNISQCENSICHSLQYWVSFILECCAHSKIKPHIIFVGSHEDQLTVGDIEQRYLLVEGIVPSRHDSNQFYRHKGTVYLDCTRPVSPGLDLLRYYLQESCNSIREHARKIDQRCYVLHRYVRNTEVQGCTLESISKDLDGNSHLLPSNPTELLPLFQTLHDKGQVLLLRNKQNLGKSWVITDIAAVLKKVTGSIFAPHDFPTHTSLGSTGVVAKSRITEVFSDLNIDMIIGFLEHFEFCHRVEPGLINLYELGLSTKEITDDEYYLFPALVTSDRPLHAGHGSSYCCGWLMHSSAEHQFFTTRFLHVLLLRLAFLFSQPHDDATLQSAKSEALAVEHRCKMWKNGITWHDANGISTLFEMRELRTVVLCMTCMESSKIHCVRLRSQLIQAILKSKSEFCPRVLTEEFIVEVADDSLLQAVDECPPHSIKYLSSRISKRSANDNTDLTFINPDGSPGKQISELLHFEPYALLTPDLITKLFTKETAKQPVSDEFITELAKLMYPFCDTLLQVLEPSSRILSKKCVDIHDSLGEISKQQLMCEHIVETWMEQQKSATYRNLKQQLDRYSIFCGRNPLNLQLDEDSDVSGDESDDNTDRSVPQSGQDRPTFTECLQLQGLRRRINIPQEIGTNEKLFGTFLLEDRTGQRVNAIKQRHMNDAEKVNMTILEEWIAGKGKHPVTWTTLTETLCDTGLNELAGEIAAVKTAHSKSQLSKIQIDRPTLIECVRFRGREKRINISQEIGTNYITFGTLLLEERTGGRVKTIAHKHNDSEQTTMEILEEWIAGRGKHPVTWNTLVEVLHDIELCALAREIKAIKLPAEDRPTQDLNQKTIREIDAVKLPAKDVEDRPSEDTEERTVSDVRTGVAEDSTQ